MYSSLYSQAESISKIAKGKKILFASVPADGHVNPLTGLAVHLKKIGYDVRWYTSGSYARKINQLGIPHYPFIKALDVKGDNMKETLLQRKKHKSTIARLNFDLINAFTLRAPEYYYDIRTIYRSFAFDCLIADCAFSAIPFIKEKMNIPVIGIGVFPLTASSKDLPPFGLGMLPSYSVSGRFKQGALRWLANHILFKKTNKALAQLCEENGIDYKGRNIFNFITDHCTLFLQTATPAFEYRRTDLSKNIRFLGPLLPHTTDNQNAQWFDERLNKYERVALVTQGTIEKDVEKLLIPTLEAFKDTDLLVIATTGGSCTETLRKKFPHDNIIIEDFIPFPDIMPYTDVYISNGGYGGVILAIENEIPMVVAGVHEGKREINARIGYFRLGINMRSERPGTAKIKKAVIEVLNNVRFKTNVKEMAKKFNHYSPTDLCAAYVGEILQNNRPAQSTQQRTITLY